MLPDNPEEIGQEIGESIVRLSKQKYGLLSLIIIFLLSYYFKLIL